MSRATPLLLTVHGRSLPDSQRPPQGLRQRVADLAARATASLLGVTTPGRRIPLPQPALFPPCADSRRFGSTHYGIMIPDLPAPHHFLSCASLLGMPGLKITDVDHAISADGPRHTAVLVHGTAAARERAFTAYSMRRDMELAADGSHIGFGQDLELSGHYPDFRLRSQRQGFSADLRLTATGELSWFAHSPLYQHLSLLVRYEGSITGEGQTSPVSGLGTWEYWRVVSAYLPRNRLLPRWLKVPGDFFTYQVINLDPDTQLLLAYVTLADRPVCRGAWLRQAGQDNEQLDATVHFRVLTAQAQAAIAPDGFAMTLPETFRWTITDRAGSVLFDINATVDTPMLYGLAAGYVGGYRWQGSRTGRPASGRGYIEYIDQRD